MDVMSKLGLVFIGAGLLFMLRPSAAARYPDSDLAGQRIVRYIAAPVLVVLGILLSLEITLQ
jgi:hypothetical protein